VTCSPNDDGTIERAEVPLAAGLHATFEVATGATFDTAGVSNTDGSRSWNLDVTLAGDHALLLETQAIDPGAWYAGDFPGATYAARLSDTNDLLGIFKLTNDALLLMGVASPIDGADATKLVFLDKSIGGTPLPVTVLSFPLTEGKTWTTLVAVTGKAAGITIAGIYNEQYTSTVDAHGTLKTPYADFKVLRVNTKLERWMNNVLRVQRTHSFVTECFGTVGTILSEPVDTVGVFGSVAEDFTATSEIWRFAP
jgi:hypothetical protein